MSRRTALVVGAIAAGVAGCVSAVFIAFLYVATYQGFGIFDMGAFTFWTAPLVAVVAAVGLLTRPWFEEGTRRRRYGLSIPVGLCCGLVWTVAVALGMSPWVGAFSLPILYCWMLGGLLGMMSWVLILGRARSRSTVDHTRHPMTVRRVFTLVVGVPIGAMMLAFGISYGSVVGSAFVWNRAEPELHLLPDEFEGPVLIVFNDSTGAAPKYENGTRVYEIPASGALRTQFPPNPGWSRPTYVYVDDEDTRSPVVTGSPCEDHPGDPVQACRMSRRFTDQLTPEYQAYVVGREANRREMYMRGDSLLSAILFEGR